MLLRSCFVMLFAGLMAGCSIHKDVRRTTNKELRTLLDQGRKVPHAVFMREASSFGLLSSNAQVYRIERGHDDTTVSLIQFDTTQGSEIKPEDAADFASAWLADYAVELGLGPDDLKPYDRFAMYFTDKVYSLTYARYYQGVPVRDARVEVNFAVGSNGLLKFREVVNRGHGAIRLENPEAQPATLDDIVEVLADANIKPLSVRQVIYPIEDADQNVTMVQGTEVQGWDTVEEVAATLTFRNGDLKPLEAYHHRYGERARIEAAAFNRNYMDATRANLPLPFITPNGATVPTDADGYYDATLTEGASVAIPLNSARVRAVNSGSNAPLTVNGIYSAQTKKVTINPSNAEIVGVNAFLSIQRINSFVRRHMRDAESGLLGRAIVVNTNVAGSCNAFYDGQISLYAAGQGCANMALVNDVAYHEWGHGLDDSLGGITDGAYSEGIGDILAGYYTNSSNMAPGFNQGSSQGIRQLENNFRFPENTGNGVHQEGLTIGGTFWDLRKALVARYGATRGGYLAERMFFRHLLISNSYRTAYQNVLTIDDDDGNPMTPSPNRCLITTAFAKHGLATEDPNCKDVEPAFAAVPTLAGLSITVDSAATDGVKLLGSAPETVRTLFACLGTEVECVAAKREDVKFTLDGSKGGKILFVANTAVNLVEQQHIVVFAKDEAGTLLGKRSFLVHMK